MKKSGFRFTIPVLLAFVMSLLPGFSACTKDDPPENTDEWTIVLDYNDGVSRDERLYVEKTKSVTLPDEIVREGYAFSCWKTEGGEVVPLEYTPVSDVTLVAQWDVGSCTVTFDVNYEGGAAIEQTISYGEKVTEPPTPVRDAYAFRYWSVSPEGEAVDFENYPIEGDYTFYAIWRDADIQEYKVTFNCGVYEGAPAPTEVAVLEGKTIRASAAPKAERVGYKLEGWTTETPRGEDWTIDEYPAKDKPALIRFPYSPKSSLTLYAVWTIQQYTAVFNMNYTDYPSEYPYGVYHSYKLLSNENVQPPAENPTRENYTFVGWYTTALGGEAVDFTKGIKLGANAGYYAHWKHNGVETNVFHAEYVEFDPNKAYYGYSGSVNGAACIVKDTGTVGTVVKDDYPLNSALTAHNGYYVSYQYEMGCTLRFEIVSSKDVTVTLAGNFAVEGGAKTIASTGENATLIKVNGKSIDYSLNLTPVFAEHTVGAIQLVKGINVIELVVNNSNTVMGGTYRAVGFMTDYIKFTNYGDATFTWSPVYDNLEVVK